MHFEVLVEDPSGSIALGHIMEKILGANYTEHSWRMHPYKGKGRLPENLYEAPSPKNQQLLSNLPSTLRGLGKSLDDSSSVVVVVDLDDDDCLKFKQDLVNLLNICNPRPKTCSGLPSRKAKHGYWATAPRSQLHTPTPGVSLEQIRSRQHLRHMGSPC